jgi:hypothetical protein
MSQENVSQENTHFFELAIKHFANFILEAAEKKPSFAEPTIVDKLDSDRNMIFNDKLCMSQKCDQESSEQELRFIDERVEMKKRRVRNIILIDEDAALSIGCNHEFHHDCIIRYLN